MEHPTALHRQHALGIGGGRLQTAGACGELLQVGHAGSRRIQGALTRLPVLRKGQQTICDQEGDAHDGGTGDNHAPLTYTDGVRASHSHLQRANACES